jgi:hypothetical protein
MHKCNRILDLTVTGRGMMARTKSQTNGVMIDLHLTSLGEASCWIREDDEVTYRISKVLYL